MNLNNFTTISSVFQLHDLSLFAGNLTAYVKLSSHKFRGDTDEHGFSILWEAHQILAGLKKKEVPLVV